MEHGIEQVVNCELNQGKLHDPSLEKINIHVYRKIVILVKRTS